MVISLQVDIVGQTTLYVAIFAIAITQAYPEVKAQVSIVVKYILEVLRKPK